MKNRNIKYGDIFLVDFQGSIGHEFQGERPAIIIESDYCIERSNLITVIPLTSNINNRFNDDIFLKKDDKNRLKNDSVVKVDHIKSFDYSRIINKIGIADEEILEKIKKYLKKHFDL